MLSIIYSSQHYAVLWVDLVKKQIKVIDGLLKDEKPQIQWEPVVQGVFRSTGLNFAQFSYNDVSMCQQKNTNDCGLVACGVVWNLMHKLMPIPKGTAKKEKLFIKKHDNDTHPLRAVIWMKKQDLMNLHQEHLMVTNPEWNVGVVPGDSSHPGKRSFFLIGSIGHICPKAMWESVEKKLDIISCPGNAEQQFLS